MLVTESAFVEPNPSSMESQELPILVVDDNEDAVELVAAMLQHCGYRVATARSAYEAVDRLDGNARMSMIITDVRMPDVNGFDFLRLVRKRFPSVPIVLMTGLPISDEDFAPIGASILRKPFSIDELHRVIRRHLSPPG
jgi:two-component system NtrC family sensor kinase